MNSLFLRFPGGRSRAVTFSYDDGPRDDLRLAEIFDSCGMKGTFNLNSANIGKSGRLTAEEIRTCLLDRGHEIAVHGANHRAPGKLRPIEGISEVLRCREELERQFGILVRGMAYPNSGIRHFSPGVSYEQVKRYLTELDIAYARTLGGDNDGFFLPEDWHAWMPSAHHENPRVFDYIDRFLALTPQSRTGDNGMPRLLYLWGHSFEFGMRDNWERIEKICEALSGIDDIWYATNGEIHDYVEAYKALVWSADGSFVFNPTLRDVHMVADDTPVCVRSGETLRLG